MPDACLGASLAAEHWTQGAVWTHRHVPVCMQRNKSKEGKEYVTETFLSAFLSWLICFSVFPHCVSLPSAEEKSLV